MKPGNKLKESVLNFPFKVQYFNSSQGLRNTKLNMDHKHYESKGRRCHGIYSGQVPKGYNVCRYLFLNALQSHAKTNLWFIHCSSLREIFKKNYFPNSTSVWKSKDICCSLLYHQTLHWTHFEHFFLPMPYLTSWVEIPLIVIPENSDAPFIVP